MRWVIISVFVLLFSNVHGQTYVHPNAQKYLYGISAANSAQKLSGNRTKIAHNMILSLSMNCRYGTDTFISIWSKLGALFPMLGDTANSVALGFDAVNLNSGTYSGTITFFKDSMKSNGVNGFYVTRYIFGASATYNHLSYWTTTESPFQSSGSTIMTDIADSLANAVLSIRAITFGGVGAGVGTTWFKNYSATNLYKAYSESTTTGFWVNTRVASDSVRMIHNGTNITGSPAALASAASASGRCVLFKSQNGSFSITNRACSGASVGQGLTVAEAASLYRSFKLKMNNL